MQQPVELLRRRRTRFEMRKETIQRLLIPRMVAKLGVKLALQIEIHGNDGFYPALAQILFGFLYSGRVYKK
jgi:hypothetical protein